MTTIELSDLAGYDVDSVLPFIVPPNWYYKISQINQGSGSNLIVNWFEFY